MKKFAIPFCVMLLGGIIAFAGNEGVAAGETPMKETSRTITVTIETTGRKVAVKLLDSPMSRDFVSLLPLTATFKDYPGPVGAEKIADLPRKLATPGGLTGSDAEGDFTYYEPWGNMAFFYEGVGNAGRGLHILGRIASGKEYLADMTGDFAARIELVE